MIDAFPVRVIPMGHSVLTPAPIAKNGTLLTLEAEDEYVAPPPISDIIADLAYEFGFEDDHFEE